MPTALLVEHTEKIDTYHAKTFIVFRSSSSFIKTGELDAWLDGIKRCVINIKKRVRVDDSDDEDNEDNEDVVD